MNLETTLNMLAAQLHIDPAQLIEYAHEADALGIGGYHWKADQQVGINGTHWPSGSLWAVEGAILYALIRYYKFEAVAEIGGYWGCSATHMAAAMAANGGGTVYSVDSGALRAEHGSLIPTEYRFYVKLVNAMGQDWLAEQADESLGLVFSDADHTTETTRDIALAAKPKIIDGGLFVEHDAGHDFYVDGTGSRSPDPAQYGAMIRKGLDLAAMPYRVYLTDPSDCGIALAEIKHRLPKEFVAWTDEEIAKNNEPKPIEIHESPLMLQVQEPKKPTHKKPVRKPRKAAVK